MDEEQRRKIPLRLRLLDGLRQRDDDEYYKKSDKVKKQFSKIKTTSSVKSPLKTTDTPDEEMSTPVTRSNVRQNFLYKFCWMVVNVFAIAISIYFIKTAFDDWQNSPIVQAVSNNQVPYQNISFPAVTLCWPQNLNRDYDLFKNTEECLDCKEDKCTMKNETCSTDDMMTLFFAFSMCVKRAQALPKEFYAYFFSITNKTLDRREFDMYMKRVIPSCEYDFLRMKVGYEYLNVSRCEGHIFQQFFSQRINNLCMTYNGLRHEDIYKDQVVTSMELSQWSPNLTSPREARAWSFDNMMDFKGGLDTVPIYNQKSLSFYLYRPDHIYQNICHLLDSNIATVIIHSPNEIPILEELHSDYIVHADSFKEFLFEPKITLARDLDHFSPEQRGCLFSHEKEMTMFKFYSKNNCYVECIVDSYLRACGCVPYIYPRPNASVDVCLFPCVRPLSTCECLPDCNFLRYSVTNVRLLSGTMITFYYLYQK
jgi:amiloride-sensitive sodium channel